MAFIRADSRATEFFCPSQMAAGRDKKKPECQTDPSPENIPERARPIRNEDLPEFRSQRENIETEEKPLARKRPQPRQHRSHPHAKKNARQRRPRIPPRRRIQPDPHPVRKPGDFRHLGRRNPGKVKKRHEGNQAEKANTRPFEKKKPPASDFLF